MPVRPKRARGGAKRQPASATPTPHAKPAEQRRGGEASRIRAAVEAREQLVGIGRPQRVCVFRALQLGDMLCAVPALRSLRAGLPEAAITLVGLPWAQAFAHRYRRYVDDFVAFPGHSSMPEQPVHPERWPGFIAAMRNRHFDLAVQLHGSGESSNAIVASFGAARCAGFAAGPLPAATFLAWDPREPEPARYVRLMRHLGLPDLGQGLEWPWLAEDVFPRAAQELEGRPYVCIHPGARLPSRRWPPERFAQVADRLARAGFAIAVTGSADEAALARRVVRCMRAAAVDLAGRSALGELARLIARAALVVCNDTGISHVAAAVGTPSVVVCCGADPGRWAPLDRSRHRVLHHPVDCRPCMHLVCPIGHPCATGVEAGRVAEEALALLAGQPERAGSGERAVTAAGSL